MHIIFSYIRIHVFFGMLHIFLKRGIFVFIHRKYYRNIKYKITPNLYFENMRKKTQNNLYAYLYFV